MYGLVASNLTVSSINNHHLHPNLLLLNSISFHSADQYPPRNKFPPFNFKLILCRRPFRLLQASDDDDVRDTNTPSSSNSELEEAKIAVSKVLQEFGASEEESVKIAANSPKYVESLIDSVRELDDLSSLWNNSQQLGGGVSFREKVYHMSKDKRDRGMIPLLESSGLSLSGATHVARYLTSQSLPDVIGKVKFVKEIFFSNSDDKGLIGRNACRMMMHLSVPADEDLQQTLSYFEKVGARRGGLNLLGSKDVSFRYLIESFPRLLLLQVESSMKQLVDLFENIGLSKGCMSNILLLFPPVIFYDIEKNIKPRLRALQKIGARDEDIGRMLLKYPWVLSMSIQENYEEILSFFDVEKVPRASVYRAIRSWPHIVGCSVGRMKVMLKQFGELGAGNKKLGQVIASSPQLLLRKPHDLMEVVSFLKDVGLDEKTINQIFCRCPEIFAASSSSIEKTLQKKLDHLNGMGVPKKHFPRVIRKYPELFVSDFNTSILPRIHYLMKNGGLSKREIAVMICRFSPLLGYSIEQVLRPKLEFLVKTMEKPPKEVVDYPRYFSYSLDSKIRPRFWVLKARNVQCTTTLRDMLGKNDDEFATEFYGGF